MIDDALTTDRRAFLRRGAMGAGALWMFSLQEFATRQAYAGSVKLAPGESPYGPISPKLDETTGLPLLMLPDGFRYLSYSWTGDVMSDGVACPSLHDGMAVVLATHLSFGSADSAAAAEAVDGSAGKRAKALVLVRNHEPGAGTPYLNHPDITFAADGAGGTTNLVFDPTRGEWLKSWSSLAGTIRNCAGAVTPWGTWLTCEETGDAAGHGWSFEVGALKGDPRPLRDMGRFSHEAGMVDPKTGFVYETEDANDCGFYKFVPYIHGQLDQGGRLYMLSVKNHPNADLGVAYPIGTTWDVEWVRIDDPEATEESTYAQGAAKGGARFRRLEGAWWGHKRGYFLSTDGGQVGEGQVFEYDPRAETLKLIYDSPDYREVENPDNITVTPRGGLLLCEDNSGTPPGPPNAGERLIGLTLHGQTFTFAQNNVNLAMSYNEVVGPGDYRQSEWAGANYSPDGKWLFVNIQTPGITFAITGPWGHGPL